MPWMPHSMVKGDILLNLDKLCEGKEGRDLFKIALDYVFNNNLTFDELFRSPSPENGQTGLNGKGVSFDLDVVNHVRDHWINFSVVGKWDGPRANSVFLRGWLRAVDEATRLELPLNTTWICPGRENPNPEVLIIRSMNDGYYRNS